jgi:hypothetical protein
VFPAIVVSLMDVQQSWAMFLEVLHIMVGVAIDTMQQINHTCWISIMMVWWKVVKIEKQ